MSEDAAKKEEPPTKKVKSSPMEQSPASEWPEAWIMPEGECKDQKAPNKQSPNVPVTVEQLQDLGICYWKLDAGAYDYPKISVPWDPKDAIDPKLTQLRDDRGYNYADIITVHPDTLPQYEIKVKAFFEEHIHDAEEIRYILGGSGYFDVRDKKDQWVRIHIKAGDLMTLPEGIYHRFTVDEADMIHAMRLFIGVDTAFGGLPTFGKEKGGGESVLNRAGGSVIVVAPPENATSSQCIRKMVDMSETSPNLPLSFGVVLTSDCFVNASTTLTVEDLRALDPRLCGEKKGFISFIEVIPAGSSIFSKLSSMFLLIQNEAGKIRFPTHPTVIDIIRRSLRSDIGMSNNAPMISNLPGMSSETQYDAASFSPVAQPQYAGASQEVPLSSNPWGQGGGGNNRGRGHRGRLFELVGDEEVEEDQGMSNILPGMLDSLNMNMFGSIPNTNDEVDIEAISLMGIGLNGAMNSNYHQS